jgi:hypothetical protein
MNRACRRHAWWAVGALALAVLLVLALLSPQRRGSLGESTADGPMRHVNVDAVQRVQVRAGSHVLQAQRTAAGGWSINGQPLSGDAAAQLQAGLRLLHNTAPERRFDADQPDFGLATPALSIDVRAADGRGVEVTFGAANPAGLARYARVLQGPEAGLVMLPSDVHDHWQQWLRSAAP